MTELGPNVKRLIIHKMSHGAISAGGGLSDAISFFTDTEKRARIIKESEEWVKEAISITRRAEPPNPWKDSTDEEIAGEILRRLEERKK